MRALLISVAATAAFLSLPRPAFCDVITTYVLSSGITYTYNSITTTVSGSFTVDLSDAVLTSSDILLSSIAGVTEYSVPDTNPGTIGDITGITACTLSCASGYQFITLDLSAALANVPDAIVSIGLGFTPPIEVPYPIPVSGFADPVGVPGPIAGAGLPGMAFAVGAFLAWRRRRQPTGAPAPAPA